MAEGFTPTPRDELLDRVVTGGRRLIRLRRILIGLAVAAGAVAVTVGVALGASNRLDVIGDQPVVVPAAAAPFSACPGTSELGVLHRNDRVFLTGVDPSGAWVELRSPVDPDQRVWMQAAYVTGDQAVSGLPTVDRCGTGEYTLVLPGGEVEQGTTTTTSAPDSSTTTTEAGASTTTTTAGGQQAAPTTRPGVTITPGQPPVTVAPTSPPATASPTTSPPTTAPDTTGPSIGGLSRSPSAIWENDGLGITCSPPKPRTSQVTATVSDPSGVASVVVYYSVAGKNGTVTRQAAMSLSGGTYRATVGSYPAGTIADGTTQVVGWTVVATDGKGNQRAAAANATITLHGIGECFG